MQNDNSPQARQREFRAKINVAIERKHELKKKCRQIAETIGRLNQMIGVNGSVAELVNQDRESMLDLWEWSVREFDNNNLRIAKMELDAMLLELEIKTQ